MSENRRMEMMKEAIKDIPWRERIRSFNMVRCYIHQGNPIEQFLEDHKELVERHNITIDDLMYIVEVIKEYEAGL